MVSLFALWLPIVLSSVIVFLVSFLIHTVFAYHRGDFRSLPDEDGIAAALRKAQVPPGSFMLPHAGNPSEMRSPEFREKMEKGPIAIMTVRAGGKISMSSNLIQWFLYSIVIGIFSAYVASRALGADAHYLHVFRFVGFTAFMCYTVAGWQDSIWWSRPWSITLKNTFDGLIYALLTAGVFGWLWPR
jgi:hypothetical protein